MTRFARAAIAALLFTACSTEPADVNVNIIVEAPETPVADTDTDSDPDVDTDMGIEIPEYNGQRAVVEGWMSVTGVQYAQPGEIADMAWWTFTLNSFDGTPREAMMSPNRFDFAVESDGDGRFGTPVDQVVAGDIVHYCWLVMVWPDGQIGTVGHSDIGGPATNSMIGGPYESHRMTTQEDLQIGLRCQIRGDAPLGGTKVAVSMSYNIVSDADVYDASVARMDNRGTNPQYFVQVGPDSCGNYDMNLRYGDVGVSCSIPTMSFNTTGYSYPDSRDWFEAPATWNILDGVGDGVVVNDIATNIVFDRVIDFDSSTIMHLSFASLPGQWDVVPCIPGFDSYRGVSELWCQAGSVDYTVTPQMRGFTLDIRVSGLPSEVVDGVRMEVMTHFRWTDIATGFTTTGGGGYPVIDSDELEVWPYHWTP